MPLSMKARKSDRLQYDYAPSWKDKLVDNIVLILLASISLLLAIVSVLLVLNFVLVIGVSIGGIIYLFGVSNEVVDLIVSIIIFMTFSVLYDKLTVKLKLTVVLASLLPAFAFLISLIIANLS